MPPTSPRDRSPGGPRRRQPALAPRRPIEYRGSRGLMDVWAGWSKRRKLRLARTLALVVVLALIVWQCTADDGGEVTTRQPTATTKAATTVPEVAATTVTASALATQLPDKVSLAGAAPTDDGIVMAGGLDEGRSSVAEVRRFDPTDGSTDDLADLPSPRHAAAVAALGDSVLVMGGGKGSSVLDQVLAIGPDGTSGELGTLPAPRTAATAITAADGSVLVIGGSGTSEAALEVLQTTDGTTFTTVATLLHPVRFPAVAMLGRSLWVMGGEYDNALTAGVQRVDLDSGLVTDVAPLPVAISRAAGFSLGGSIFVAGGRTAEGRSDQIYRVDAITGAATSAGALPEARSDAPVAVVGDSAYVLGGLTAAATDGVVALAAH